MSKFTDYAENKIADYLRGQGLTLPDSWWLAALTAASDSSVTENAAGLSRFEIPRALADWAGTQGAGTTLVSNGTSHTTSNNAEADLGTAHTPVTVTHIGLYDDDTAGNCWMYWQLETPLDMVYADPLVLDAGRVQFMLGNTGGCTDYLSNKLIDLIFRGQAFAWPATIYTGAFTVAPTNAGGGTEVGGGVGYARGSIVPSLANISGTQGAGTTVASNGTGGRISNNIAVAHPTPTGNWGTIVAGGLFDASSGGNLLFWHALNSPTSVSLGSPAPTYQPDALGITVA